MTTNPIQPWLDRLKRRFSPALLRLGTEGARPLPGGGSSGVVGLVGRELCLYLSVDASKVPPRQRAGFVAMAVRRAAPFADPEFDALWLRDHAAVWYWSRERVRALADRADVRYRAEAMFHGAIQAGDTEQMLQLVVPRHEGAPDAGFEARIWRRGRLQASRWWPHPPDQATWQRFARGAGQDVSTPMPDVQPSPLLERAMNASPQRLEFSGRWNERLPAIATLVGAVALALIAWQAGGIARAYWSTHSTENHIARLSTQLETIIAARERADAARERIEGLLALRTPASQTRLLGEVKRLTPGQWEMVSWVQSSPEVLEVTFRMANADVAAIVAAWESSPLLQDVTPATNTRPDEVSLQARLTPTWELAP